MERHDLEFNPIKGRSKVLKDVASNIRSGNILQTGF